MTTSFWDIPNADVVVFMGSNAAENHPISFKWFLRAKQKGAKIIVVDPRFTRTASKADMWLPFRSGSDIAVLGGLINYAITHNKIHRDYVVKYTNASLLVNPNFKFEEGLFSGWDAQTKKYNQATWSFQTGPDGALLRDDTLTNPATVYQHIKRIYGEYTSERVSEISGISVEDFNKFAEIVTSTGQAGKSAVFAYAMGWTQHTKGVQNIRCSTLLQMLLGNVGVPGGGIAALRGHANVQGATDLAVLYHDLPGYLGQPTEAHKTLAEFLDKTTTKQSYWINKPKFMVSLLKAWYGKAATKANDFAYDYIPKMAGNATYSHYDIFQSVLDGKVEGLLCMGQNPAVGSANAKKVHAALAKLKWLVHVDLFDNETGEFWKLDGMDASAIDTEIFFLPAAGPLEKEGSFTNSHRLLQWKHKAIEPLGESRSDGWYINELGKRLKKLYASSTAAKDAPIRDLVWEYDHPEHPDDFDHLKVLKEINGYDMTTGKPVAGFGALKDDGTTACGCWIYSGVYPEEGVNKADARKRGAPNREDGWTEAKKDGSADYLHLGWAFAWPANRRILYNRASADPQGKTWGKVPLVWWDDAGKKWAGCDVPDMLPVEPGKVHAAGVPGDTPFIMKAQGMGGIWGPLADGPLPVHYEPVESPIQNPLYKQSTVPNARTFGSEHDKFGTTAEFPYVVTTYRLTEHQTSGVMTRTLGFLAEAFARPFVEISRELAQEQGIRNGGLVEVSSARGKVKVQAMVTNRVKPLKMGAKLVHVIGLPIHWGPKSGHVQGDIANTLTPQAIDVNVQIQESKVFLGNVKKA
ncbi:MAG: formate dehydrogenase alpha subunit [Symbiobacteriaceae bacterium]|jgi:formate dehydrogenase major subunit|nr:formate dehydrogenase alpha subunit [Symbiobacteriaceae bacterium]